MNTFYEVIIIGAGAAGLMCAIEAGKRQRRTLMLDSANKPGKKILMSGGGHCNFTNYHIQANNYISHNPHFCKSALSRFTQWDFIDMVQRHLIPYHEKAHGQLFCKNKSKDILNMLLTEAQQAKVNIRLNTKINSVKQLTTGFDIETQQGQFQCQSLVVASGGLSIPTMGASAFAYKIAEQFGINVYATRAGLVPFTLHKHDKERYSLLSGISVDALVNNDKISFRENILFTHRGLSGPALLQLSSYWYPGEAIHINLLPDVDLFEYLKQQQSIHGQQKLKTILYELLPKKLIDCWLSNLIKDQRIADIKHCDLNTVAQSFADWTIKPNATEGYRTAEVTLGGVDCDALSSKTMEVNAVPGLYFIGEAIDVTGWLGGYNFQWAWSSGFAAGQVV